MNSRTMPGQLRVRATDAPWRRAVEFAAIVRDGSTIYAAVPLVMETVTDGAVIEPTFELAPEDAQILMDDLWNCGIRPTEGTGSAGALAATQRHLEDMRRLVFENVAARRPDIRAARPGELNEGAR